MAEAEGESLESWLSEYPGPLLSDLQARAAFSPHPDIPAAEAAHEHRAFTPLGEWGPFPAAHPARDTCSSRARGPGKSDSRVLGADRHRRVGEVAGPCTPKPQRCQSSGFGLVPPGVMSDASRTHIAESVCICIPAVLRQDA